MEKVKKSSKIILPICLIVAMVMAIFSFAGCGTDVGTLSENIKTMNETLASYSTLFVKDDQNLNTRDYYKLNYGTIVDDLILSGTDNYDELYNYYNSIFSLAMSYVDENLSVVTNLIDEEMNDETRNSLDELNQKIVDFNNEISPFVSARNEFTSYFNEYSDPFSSANLSQLRSFKRQYASFVDKAVEISLSLRNAVEATGDLKEIVNVALVKNSICNELLPIYHEFLVMNIGTFNFSESAETVVKERINTIIANLENSLNSYISLFQTNTGLKELTLDELNKINQEAENFLTEVSDYMSALNGLNLQDLAINNYNDFDEYLKNNKNAEIYLEKLEQFTNVNGTLETYLARLTESVTLDEETQN